jgi:hypothetical protein
VIDRFVNKCPGCKAGIKFAGAESYRPRIGKSSGTVIGSDRFFGDVMASEMGSGYDVIVPCACGKFVRCKRVYTKGACTAKCSGTCTHAKGPSCDCSCRGANHGSGL